MINRVVLVGRLTKNPDLRHTPNGISVSSFTLAVNRTFTNAKVNVKRILLTVLPLKKQQRTLITTYQKEV